MLLTTVGAFAAFSLMTIAIGTDYWLYSRAHICNGTNITLDDMPKKTKGDLTHSGLWRICCIEDCRGSKIGLVTCPMVTRVTFLIHAFLIGPHLSSVGPLGGPTQLAVPWAADQASAVQPEVLKLPLGRAGYSEDR
ncbi:hypothetical protein NDU88_007886 [Pleurodeles waltl]|uniref:Uncharacterized protein n=1 Tax=Pleurodeles waltl TaxID=8319 RepID=A0AAV7PMP5_PLEWA|nr:hypothetical protein NDU88_007886 [Pleurodeles waltl]